ncbi:MAG: beta-glucosidase [Chitinispirillaceae bacterium]|nr:beta-glucosidase [Chitinispirillaceae bacterium]
MEVKPSTLFPGHFIWGAAASSYQIEGAAEEDGRGLSVWDEFCRREGAVARGETGDVSCDHYHHFREDVKLLREIGVGAYRFSLSWPRVLPEGNGAPNARGIAFYSALVDALLACGIEPWVTLFHWDYPVALFRKGGWLARESADWFADYARVVVDALSDRVSHWMTINEPRCFIGYGHQTGYHAPGLQCPFPEVLRAGHHALLAHGKAVAAIRAHARTTPVIGAAPDSFVHYPATESDEDRAAAAASMFAITQKNVFNNNWFSDPMVLGRYPDDGVALFGSDMPSIAPDDMKTIRQPLDFFGINIYQGIGVRAGRGGVPETVPHEPGHPMTAMGWAVTPRALYWGPKYYHERYRLPIVITENGMANNDWVQADGKVRDPQRIDFMKRYLAEYARAIRDGVDGRGYFYWSIMDNFEWAEGYAKRFGLVHVDYETQRRTVKDSGEWYRRVIASGGAEVTAPATSASRQATRCRTRA